MNIQLPNGKTISISAYEYYFLLKDDEIEEFYRHCMADNLGNFIENPFGTRAMLGDLEIDENPEEIDDFISQNEK